jgi:4-oxalocrotonate tautomerase
MAPCEHEPFSRLSTEPMPTLHAELFAGRTVEQKRALAAALTEATVRTLGGSPDAVDVIFRDVERHDWATAGTLWSDKAPVSPTAPKP